MFKDANRALRLVAAAMADAQFNRAKLAERAEQNWITVTELADTLARDHGAPFKVSHAIAVRLVAECTTNPAASRAAVLRELSKTLMGKEISYTDTALAELLSARHFVEVRTTPGGPAPSETARAIGVSRETLTRDEAWLGATRGRLAAAAVKLKAAAAAL
jgi:argininosuccinate lyase